MDINGASAIVTGGASGIGAAVARQLAAKGAKVVVADLNSDKGEELANEIGGVFAPVDVTKTEQIKAAIEQAEAARPGPRAGQLRRHRLGAAHGRPRRHLRVRGRPRGVLQGDRDQPDRHLRLHPPRRYGDLPHRAAPSPASAARSSTWPASPRSTGRSARRRTPRPRAAWSA